MRSVAKNRSATSPTKNGETIAASAVVLIGSTALPSGELQRLQQVGPHRHVPAPQMKYRGTSSRRASGVSGS